MAAFIGDEFGAVDDLIDQSASVEADHLAGFEGNDTLIGGAFGSQFMGWAGNDEITGGGGNDVIDGDGRTDLKIGSNNHNYTLYSGKDLIDGGAGNDALYGGGEDDTIVGGDGNDAIYADHGILQEERDANGVVLLYMKQATSAYEANTGTDKISGDAGADTIVSLSGADILDGGSSTTGGNEDVDLLRFEHAGATTALVIDLTIAGPQTLADGASIENFEQLQATGGTGGDRFIGADLNDTLIGGWGNDQLTGGLGDDSLNGGDGRDWALYSGAGSAVTVNLADTTATGGAGTDTLIAIDNVAGSAYDDQLTGDQWMNFLGGGAGNDTLKGADGRDGLNGGQGDDSLNGGLAVDSVSYVDATSGVNVSLAAVGSQNTGGAGSDTLVDVENLIGSAHADTLTGNEFNNLLKGGGGADTLEGGSGADAMFGGGGADLFVFLALGVGSIDRDRILDLEAGEVIDLSAVDANFNDLGNQAFVRAAKFTGEAGQLVLRYNATADRTQVSGDVDGNKTADFIIILNGDQTAYDDFVL